MKPIRFLMNGGLEMYYNEERKQRYIKYKNNISTLPYNFLPCWFSKAYMRESKLRLDICDWPSIEIVNFYKYYNVDIGVLRNVQSQFYAYTEWCIQNGLANDVANHFSEIGPDVIESCMNKIEISKTVISRETLLIDLQMVINPVDRFLMLALFEGIKGEEYSEIIQASLDQIDGNYINTITGRKIPISDQLKIYAKDAAEEYVYYVNQDRGRTLKLALLGTDNMICKTPARMPERTIEGMHRTLHTRFRNIQKQTGWSSTMRLNHVFTSGAINAVSCVLKEYNIDLETLYRNTKYRTKKEELIAIYGSMLDPEKNNIFFKKYGEYL